MLGGLMLSLNRNHACCVVVVWHERGSQLSVTSFSQFFAMRMIFKSLWSSIGNTHGSLSLHFFICRSKRKGYVKISRH
uniref:Uncharacterized protein n=1 Tax=Kalanchoe fedtschenkoi TaxID=63787 RepID=A0A7N0U2U0_KALFE